MPTIGDVVVILALAAVVALVIWRMRADKRKGRSCCGNCSGCSGCQGK